MNYSCKPAPEVEGPYIVLANHTTNWDPVLVGCSFKKPMNFIASEHAMRMGFLSKIISSLFMPIQRVKGSTDASAALGMVSMLRKGISVGLFPEGSRSFDGTTEELHPTTGRLIKMSGASLITYRLQGGYLTSPRWGYKTRRGKMYGEVVNVYTPEQLKAMTPAQITDCINRDIAENAYDRQREKAYNYHVRGNAEGIERVLYLCPECNSIGSITSKGNALSCTCGMHATMNKHGFFEGKNVRFDSIDRWNVWQKEQMKKLLENENFRLEDNDQQLYVLDKDHNLELKSSGAMSLDKNLFRIGDMSFEVDKLQMSIIRKQDIVFSSGGVNYEIHSDKSRSAYKYTTMLKMLQANTAKKEKMVN
ncbi:MAG: 1-acyl-sn-glycerol-3-phosphate acyltransferase [Clostridia bacterium]|nr:1-acyl-sn-glycerol-3-phosphate acyltransferase [Clostridia bacterium]